MLKNRMILLWVVVIFLFYCLSATFVFAKGGGKGDGSSSPHGWSQGKKKGWNTDVPPGLEKKGEDLKPSDLTDEKKDQKENQKVEKRKEQQKDKEKKRHKEKEQKDKSKEKEQKDKSKEK